MGSRGDPFDFNDIYSKLGADGLVHKPMKAQEVKKTADGQRMSGSGIGSAGGPVPGASMPAPQISIVAASAPIPTGMSSSLGLDDLFLGPKPKVDTPSCSVADDPFAAFGAVDGALPVVESSVPGLDRPNPCSGSNDLLGLLDDHSPLGQFSSPLQQKPTALHPPEPLPKPLVPLSYQQPGDRSSSPVPVAAQIRSPSPAHASGLPPRPSQPDISVQQLVRPPIPPSNTYLSVNTSGGLPMSVPARSSVDGQYSQEHKAYEQQQHYDRENDDHDWPGTSASVPAPKAPATSVLGGFFKKAVKAAQSGLQHLESALEKGFEAPQSRSNQQVPVSTEDSWSASKRAEGTSHSASGKAPTGRLSYGSGPAVDGSSHGTVSDEDSGKALEVAIRITELPMEVRADALAGLRPGLKERVEELLREQAMLEDNESNVASAHGQHGYEQVIHTHEFNPFDEISSVNETSDRGTQPQAAAMASLVGDLLDGPPKSFPEPSSRSTEGFGDLIGSSTPVLAPQSSAPRSAAPVTDLMGGFEEETYTTESHITGPPLVPSKTHVVDLMGGFEDSSFPPSSSTGDPATSSVLNNPLSSHAALVHVSDDFGDDFFSGGAANKPSSAPDLPATSDPPARASIPPASRPSRPVSRPNASDLIGDLHSLGDVDVGNNQHLYEVDQEGEEGEPELRKQLRATRLAEKHAKMKAALAEKLANDENEAKRREEQVQIKDQYKDAINVWKNKNKGNIRGMLGSLQNVLWEGSGWVPVSVGDLLDGNQVKRVYMKANLLVHPDKVRQRNGTPEQVAIADMVFDVLKEAWGLFKP